MDASTCHICRNEYLYSAFFEVLKCTDTLALWYLTGEHSTPDVVPLHPLEKPTSLVSSIDEDDDSANGFFIEQVEKDVELGFAGGQIEALIDCFDSNLLRFDFDSHWVPGPVLCQPFDIFAERCAE